MASGTPTLVAPAKLKLLKGVFNLSSDALKVALVTSAITLSAGWLGASGDARYADITAAEVANGNGYTTGGQALAGVTLSYYVAAAAVVNAGSGGTNGVQTVTGTTGNGTKFTASVNVANGIITGVNSITLGGAYSTLPTNPAAEPVTGGGLTGATLALTMGIQFACTNPSWTAASFTAKYLVIYDSTAANKDILCYIDWETAQANGLTVSNGTLTYNEAATGIIQFA